MKQKLVHTYICIQCTYIYIQYGCIVFVHAWYGLCMCCRMCVCKIVWYCHIREQEPSEGVQEDDIDDKDEEEFEPKGNSYH